MDPLQPDDPGQEVARELAEELHPSTRAWIEVQLGMPPTMDQVEEAEAAMAAGNWRHAAQLYRQILRPAAVSRHGFRSPGWL
jgi:hypothetical protein